MKVKITFKDPDGVWDCVQDAVQETMPDGLTADEENALLGSRTANTFDALRKWIEFKEYLTVEFDTESGSATVLPTREIK